jgi:hypothetical protein
MRAKAALATDRRSITDRSELKYSLCAIGYCIYIMQNNIDARDRAIIVKNPVPPTIPDPTIEALDALVVADAIV